MFALAQRVAGMAALQARYVLLFPLLHAQRVYAQQTGTKAVCGVHSRPIVCRLASRGHQALEYFGERMRPHGLFMHRH
eukprot:365365-Chlamydomonas_euryale.AAC.9